MSHSSDPKKLALWQERFRRFVDSGLGVARFCAVEHVSESSFYYWRKKLGPRARRRPAGAEHRGARTEDRGAGAEHHGVGTEYRSARAEYRSTRAEYRDIGAELHHGGCEDRNVFQPVTVVPAVCGVVVRLPGGTRIEVGTEHLDAIRAVVAEAVRVDHGRTIERNVSSDSRVTRNPSCDHQVTGKTSCDSRVIRKRGGTVRTEGGTVSC